MAWQTLDQQYEQQNNRNDRSNYLKDIIAGLSIATNNDPMTLLGYGISKFLSNYVNRGLERRQQEKNQKAYDEATGAAAQPQAQPQPQTTGGLLENLPADETLQIAKGTPFVSDAARSLMPNIDWQNRGGAPSFFDKAASENKPQQAALENPAAPQPTQNENLVSEIANQISRQPTRSPQDFSMTSEEVYKRAFDIARANGSTMDQARQFAQQQAGLYQSQRVQALSDQFLNGGVNPDGTINNNGVSMLAQMLQESPDQTKLLGGMYQTPQGATNYAQEIAKLMMNSNLRLNNAKELANLEFTNSQRAAEAQQERQRAARIEAAQNAADAAIMQSYLEAVGQNIPHERALEYAQQQGEIAFLSAMSGGRGYTGGRSNGSASGGRSNNGTAQSGGNGQMSAKTMKDLIGVYQTQKEIADNYVLSFEEKYKDKPKEMESDPNYKQYQDMKKESARLEKLIMGVGKNDDTFTANTPAEAIEQIRTKHPEWSPDYIQWIVQNMPGFKDFYQFGNNGQNNGVQVIPQSKGSNGGYTDEELEYLER